MSNSNELQKLHKKLKNRKIFIIVLLICIPITAWFTPQYFGLDPVKDSEFPLLDPLRKFISPNDYITNIQDLRLYLSDLGDKYPDNISIYYENINSGSNISVHKDLHLFPASLSKLVQAILIAEKVEKGVLSWDTELKALPEDLSDGSGDLYKTIGSNSMTVAKLMKELLVNSDNTAQNIFKHYIEIPDYINFQNETGLQDLYNDQGLISAKEYTRILRVLYTSSYLKPESSQKILDCMSKATFRDYLSQGIPDGVIFAHKYGENVEQSIFSDSGIVYIPNKPYMITVIIKGKDSTIETRNWATQLMKEISLHAYEASK
jgi:hypothetical protein